MCGIHLIIDNTKSIDAAIIGKMANQTHHRGPDETVLKTIEKSKKNYHLAANRLKITDQTEFSRQPFMSSDQRFALLFNGEIYNFYTLKNELLSKGIQFSSPSDTEVLFHWLCVFGEAGIQKLQGMFALVFFDFERDKVLIARDRFGIKPVYYYQDDRYMIVSSEIQPIVQTCLFPKKLNESQVNHYLLYKYVKSPETIYEDVSELEPGHRLLVEKGNLETESFVTSIVNEQSNAYSTSDIENLIRDSLLQQINAPVPVGLLLSGGVDSTLLLALAKAEGFTMPTFSIVNQEVDKSFGTEDYKYARKAALKFGSEHHETTVDISILNQFENYIQKMDQPIGDSSYLMTSEICRYASDPQSPSNPGIKVLLSGAGADEVFGGYNRHLAFYRYLNYKNILSASLPFTQLLSSWLPTGFPHPFRKEFKLIKKFVASVDISPEKTFHNFLIFNELENKSIRYHFSNQSNWMAWALDHDLKNYLLSDVLALSDKAAMLHGIELRVPYLDENLVNYMNGLPSDAIFKHGIKWILKDLLTKYGGKEFAKRPKEGFGLPLSGWIVDKSVRHLWEFMYNPDHIVFRYLDKQLVEHFIAEQKSKEADHGPLLWSILTLSNWLERNFE
jgi:asparagine synthase (glutamine-hydrolysing)